MHAPLRLVVSIGEACWTSLHAGISRIICIVGDVVETSVHTLPGVILSEKPIRTVGNA
jgi:hypothetical protein